MNATIQLLFQAVYIHQYFNTAWGQCSYFFYIGEIFKHIRYILHIGIFKSSQVLNTKISQIYLPIFTALGLQPRNIKDTSGDLLGCLHPPLA